MNIKKTVLKTEITYIVFPQGLKFSESQLDDAIKARGEAGTIREYTVIIKKLEIFADNHKNVAKGTYISSKEVKPDGITHSGNVGK